PTSRQRDVLPGPGHVPPAPGPLAISGVGMRPGAGAVDGAALPVGAVVGRPEPRPRPGRHLVALEAGLLQQAAGQLQELPLAVGPDLAQAALPPAALQQGALL